MGDTVLKTLTTPDEDPKREHRTFARQFTSSTRKAQLARRLAVQHLGEWGYPPASDTSCTVALLVAELTANAVRHGRVPGRDFHLRLAFDARTRTIRIEVSDACPDQPPTASPVPSLDDESGRGLLLVDMLATRWGCNSSCPHRQDGLGGSGCGVRQLPCEASRFAITGLPVAQPEQTQLP